MMNDKVATMTEKAKDAMKGNGTSGLRKFVRKDLKEIKERIDAVHEMIVRNVEMKLISEDVAEEQMTSLYSYADNLLETWFMQVDNTIEFYNDLKENLFADKDFSKLTDDEYKCLKLIVKERTKLQRLSAEIQSMVCYVDTMLEDFGYLDDFEMDEEDEDDDEMTDEELKEFVQSLEDDTHSGEIKLTKHASYLLALISKTERYVIEYIDDPKLALYLEDGRVITIIRSSDNVLHVSDGGADELYTLEELEKVYNKINNREAKDALDKLLKIVYAKEVKEGMLNEETK